MPYINHPIACAAMLLEAGIEDVTVLTAAILHDIVEDTEATDADLRARFGDTVADVVAEVTDDRSLPRAERKRLQVEHAGSLSHAARLVKLADKLFNTRDLLLDPPTGWSLDRIRAYFDWSKAVIDPMRGTNAALEAEFDAVYAQRP